MTAERTRKSRRCFLIFAAISIVLLPAESEAASTCDAAPGLRTPPRPIETTLPEPAEFWTALEFGGRERSFLGVGLLQASPSGEHLWPPSVLVPFYASPGGSHRGWINGGWVVEEGRPAPLSWSGLVEAAARRLSLVVWEAREDGWLKIRVFAPRGGEDGMVWVHDCRLDQGATDLEPVLWRDFFLSDRVPPLSFRSSTAHALRVGPSVDSERLAWIAGNEDFEALEIEGDWMRVRAFRPGKRAWRCAGRGAWEGTATTGWVRWWSASRGPWVWLPAPGC